ncbi:MULTISPECIES: PfkB family carbohydrate kinase [Nocardia]|uniref:PfkB family carbohydrate kinase n=1 Tax=Nocardia TaxID=1817 RepID=UPI0004A6C8FC|nr:MULTISPECIES: PfkB family carbohydrate kinase [Nocardia]
MTTQDRPVVCVSYLASAELWSVPEFPFANHGAEVRVTEQSIAADGPMTAAVLAALDVPTLLVANRIGNDEAGGRVGRWLQQRAVPTTAVASAEVSTPRIVVVADDHNTRTWFAHLSGVANELTNVDLSALSAAAFVYLDAYQLIEAAALRVVRAARNHGARLLVNLGGTPLSDTLRVELAGYANLLIQTNVDDSSHRDAPIVARKLLGQTCAQWVIVTAGAFGALAASRSQLVTAPPSGSRCVTRIALERHSPAACSTACAPVSPWTAVCCSARPVGRCGAHGSTAPHCRR